MEKKTDETIGSVRIADDVVAMIAGIAATEVEGVFSMAGNITNELMSRVGMNKLSKGVKVEMMGKRVHVDLAVVLEYGYNIPATCQKVQNRVRSAIENMTALEVVNINIRIAGVHIPQNRQVDGT